MEGGLPRLLLISLLYSEAVHRLEQFRTDEGPSLRRVSDKL